MNANAKAIPLITKSKDKYDKKARLLLTLY